MMEFGFGICWSLTVAFVFVTASIVSYLKKKKLENRDKNTRLEDICEHLEKRGKHVLLMTRDQKTGNMSVSIFYNGGKEGKVKLLNAALDYIHDELATEEESENE